ncbi:MAG TPA: helix-turn-helix transcriptional regulator [Victivallales bacterium]|nr:helix-turn-helix transcriptional regulator [Victivallales bacterium]
MKEKGISQSEVARLCNLKQQTISYIIKNNLPNSKLAPQIAEGLKIRLEWLLYGEGSSKESIFSEIPLVNNYKGLKDFLYDKTFNETSSVLINKYIGLKAFAFLYRSNFIIICYDINVKDFGFEYLSFFDKKPLITNEYKKDDSFVVFERRTRHEDF